MKRTKLTSAAGVAVVSLGLAGIAFLPASAAESDGTTTSDDDTSYLSDRLTRLKEALSGLVDDGTLSQDEADKVAETLNGSDALGPHGGGHHGVGGVSFDAAAEALGLSLDELRTALRDGSTLAEVAEAQGMDASTLVDALVQAATDHIEEEVAEGDLTQDQADELTADLEDRITQQVEEGGFGGGPGGGHGPRGFAGPGTGTTDDGTDPGTTDDATDRGATDGSTGGTTSEDASFAAVTYSWV
jgi:polyhydroxyalkanoate synthesis regulator phasin